MTNEDMEKRIEFIVEHQAQFVADLQQLTVKVDSLAEAQGRSEARLSRVEESFVLLVQMARMQDERLDTLTDKIAVLTEAQAKTDKRLADLVEAQTHTEERLNTLINVVERYISKGSNGNSPL